MAAIMGSWQWSMEIFDQALSIVMGSTKHGGGSLLGVISWIVILSTTATLFSGLLIGCSKKKKKTKAPEMNKVDLGTPANNEEVYFVSGNETQHKTLANIPSAVFDMPIEQITEPSSGDPKKRTEKGAAGLPGAEPPEPNVQAAAPAAASATATSTSNPETEKNKPPAPQPMEFRYIYPDKEPAPKPETNPAPAPLGEQPPPVGKCVPISNTASKEPVRRKDQVVVGHPAPP